jgi:CSLREA domain-containing protein
MRIRHKNFFCYFILLLSFILSSHLYAFEVDTLIDEAEEAADLGDGYCLTPSGSCSLRAAIQEANAQAIDVEITFDSDLSGSVQLTLTGDEEDAAETGDLDIEVGITIIGNGTDETVIDASNLGDRVFHLVASGAELVLKDVRVTGGGSEDINSGGAIKAEGGSIQIIDSKIDNCSTEEHGGAIDTDSTEVSIESSILTENSSNAGGAMFLENGSVEISNSSITGNLASEAGAGIIIFLPTSAEISDSIFSNNFSNGLVGAIGVAGGEVSITNTSITNNYATHFSGIGSYISTIDIVNSTIAENVAFTNSEGTDDCVALEVTLDNMEDYDCTGGKAAAIGDLFQGNSTYTITNSTISGNRADDYAGAVMLLNGSTMVLNSVTVANNTAENYGGGLLSIEATYQMQNTLLVGNAANTGPDCFAEVESLDYNLVSDQADCRFTAAENDLVGDSSNEAGTIEANIKTLSDNGGSTETHGLNSDSPAIDAGNPAGCTDGADDLETDQDGDARVIDGNENEVATCDIGATEYDPSDVDEVIEEPESLNDAGTSTEGDDEEASDEGITDDQNPDENDVTVGGGIENYLAGGGFLGCQLNPDVEPLKNQSNVPWLLVILLLSMLIFRKVCHSREGGNPVHFE